MKVLATADRARSSWSTASRPALANGVGPAACSRCLIPGFDGDLGRGPHSALLPGPTLTAGSARYAGAANSVLLKGRPGYRRLLLIRVERSPPAAQPSSVTPATGPLIPSPPPRASRLAQPHHRHCRAPRAARRTANGDQREFEQRQLTVLADQALRRQHATMGAGVAGQQPQPSWRRLADSAHTGLTIGVLPAHGGT